MKKNHVFFELITYVSFLGVFHTDLKGALKTYLIFLHWDIKSSLSFYFTNEKPTTQFSFKSHTSAPHAHPQCGRFDFLFHPVVKLPVSNFDILIVVSKAKFQKEIEWSNQILSRWSQFFVFFKCWFFATRSTIENYTKLAVLTKPGLAIQFLKKPQL